MKPECWGGLAVGKITSCEWMWVCLLEGRGFPSENFHSIYDPIFRKGLFPFLRNEVRLEYSILAKEEQGKSSYAQKLGSPFTIGCRELRNEKPLGKSYGKL